MAEAPGRARARSPRRYLSSRIPAPSRRMSGSIGSMTFAHTGAEPWTDLLEAAARRPSPRRGCCAACCTTSFDVIHAHHYEGSAGRCSGAARQVRSARLRRAHLADVGTPLLPARIARPREARAGPVDGRMDATLADHTVCVTDTIRDKLIGQLPAWTRIACRSLSNGVEIEHFGAALSPAAASRPSRR